MREFAGDTWAVLIEWGQWSRNGRPSLYGDSPLAQLLGSRRGGGSPEIQDDDALLVDRVVAELKRRDARLYAVIRLCFVLGLSNRQIARNLEVSERVADKLTCGAVGWVDSRLADYSQAA